MQAQVTTTSLSCMWHIFTFITGNQYNTIMFSILSTMLAGVVIGHFLRSGKLLENIEKTTSLTIFALLFVLGLSIGSNRLIIENLGRVGWQAVILATLSLAGSIIAARIVFQMFFKKGEEKNEK